MALSGRVTGKGGAMVGRMAELRDEIKSAGREAAVPRARKPGDTPRDAVKRRLNDRERLERMEERGLVKLGSGKIPEAFWTRPRPADPERDVMNALLDQRGSRY